MAGQNTQAPPPEAPSGLTTEQTNRITLLLAGVLVLLIFMDIQAGRQLRRAGALPAEESAETESAEAAPFLPSGKLGEILEPVREMPGLIPVQENATESGGSTEDGASTDGLSFPFPDSLDVQADPVYFYFIRFRGRGTELVRVRRSYGSKPVALRTVIETLQKGPLLRERGLLNAFDHRIKLHRVGVENGIAYVDVGSSVERMGERIIRDRLDQLVLTLTQFSEIRGVTLMVDGKTVGQLGEEQIPLPAVLTPPDRRISAFD